MSQANYRWILEHCALQSQDAADFLAYVRGLEAQVEELREIIESLRHSIEQLQRAEDRAHCADVERWMDCDGAVYAQRYSYETIHDGQAEPVDP